MSTNFNGREVNYVVFFVIFADELLNYLFICVMAKEFVKPEMDVYEVRPEQILSGSGCSSDECVCEYHDEEESCVGDL